MRRRLIVVAAAVTTMVTLAFLVPLALLVRELAASRVLTLAERDAHTLAQIIAALPVTDLASVLDSLAPDGLLDGRPVTVVLPDASVLGTDLPPNEDLTEALSGRAFRRMIAGGEVVYVPVVRPDGVAVVRILVATEALEENVLLSWFILGMLGAVLVLVAVTVADRLARSIVRPVTELSDAAHRLGEGDLGTRVEPSGPEEIVQVGRAFNSLAERIASLLQLERETAADLSHRLRTPLAAARLDAEALDESPKKERVIEDLDELARSVDHVIREARRPAEGPQKSDLANVVSERTRFWRALADEQNRECRLQVPDQAIWVPVSRDDLTALVDALLGNVFAHTPEGADFAVTVRRQGQAVLEIEDSGPGFSDLESDVERGRSTSGSTGLGLDIARRTAREAGGSLQLSAAAEGGALVSVSFPVVEAPVG